MKITILGSGTSTGVPVIGCKCDVCTSDNVKNRRLRSSILVETDDASILVDTAPDLREQSLTNSIERIDSVLYTHSHADHIFGIDELRVFNLIMKKEINCYGSSNTIENLKSFFPYIFHKNDSLGFRPSIKPHVIEKTFDLHGLTVTPVEIFHGAAKIFGYRFNNTAYLTDCKSILDSSVDLLYGLDLLIVGAVRFKPHLTHFNLEEALELVDRLKPARTLLTHLSHSFEHDALLNELPSGVEPAYDGMSIDNL